MIEDNFRDFRRLLVRHLEPRLHRISAMPLSKSSARKARIQQAIARLESGQAVRKQQLRSLLGAEGFDHYLDECDQQRDLRETLSNPPKAIREYQHLMRNALFAYSKADAASRRRSKNAGELFDRSDAEFERLIEFLREQILGDGLLESWLDRPIEVDAERAASLTPDGVPRVITSRSMDNQKGGLLAVKTTKRQLKLEALRQALSAMEETASNTCVASRMAAGRQLLRIAND